LVDIYRAGRFTSEAEFRASFFSTAAYALAAETALA